MKQTIGILFALAFVNAGYSQTAGAPEGTATPAVNMVKIARQPIKVPMISKSPTIDGRLNDEVWKNAAVMRDLIQIGPGDHIPPTKPTEGVALVVVSLVKSFPEESLNSKMVQE